MTPEQIKAAAERYDKPYPRASESGGRDHISPWVHKQEWEDLHALAQAMCDRLAADEIQRTQHCPICEARSQQEAAEKAERFPAVERLTAWIRDYGHLKESAFISDLQSVLGIKPTN